jgi:hypothetical protein
MSSALAIGCWLVLVVSMVTLMISSIRLSTRLRERYPDIYVGVGRPSAFTRNVNFLWRLKPYEGQLGPTDIKLLRLSLAIVYIGAIAAAAFGIYVVTSAF